MTTKNISMNKAKLVKNDEFYTQFSDIENELKHYQKHFEGKIVLCNCDDPRVSNFFKYFLYNFEKLKLKKLITTCYKNRQTSLFSKYDPEKAIYLEYEGGKNDNKVPNINEIGISHLKSDGDFRSKECIEILKECDIVCTNPPFSLFRKYLKQLLEYKKKFLIIGTCNAVARDEIFKSIKNDEMWISINGNRDFSGFIVPNYSSTGKETHINKGVNNVVFTSNNCWFTNIGDKKSRECLICYAKYDKEKYPKFDNYDAINVDRTKDIPANYKGKIGVPVTFMKKYNPDQFDLLGKMSSGKIDEYNYGDAYLDGKIKFTRIIIRHKRVIEK